MTVPTPQPAAPVQVAPTVGGASAAIDAVLDPEVQAQFERLLRRTLGRKFTLTVVEARTPAQRRAIVEWARGFASEAGGQVFEADLQRLPRQNLWRELRELVASEHRDDAPFVLAVSGLEAEVHHDPPGPPEQLNIQRDLFVRDLPGFWLLFLHPTGVMKLRMRAPDFCDFVSLWVDTRDDAEKSSASPSALETGSLSFSSSPRGEDGDFLDQARAAALDWRFDEARDFLARYRLCNSGNSDPREGGVLGVIAMREGRYQEAEPLLEEAVRQQEAEQPSNPLAIARALTELGELYWLEGRFQEVEAPCERAVAIWRAVLPPAHPNLATAVGNLARLYEHQGKYDEASRLYHEALAIRRMALPPEHPDLAISLSNLASFYENRGKLGDAKSRYEEALAIRRVALPPGHPDLATLMNDLAVLYVKQGKYEQAEALYTEALAIRRAALPPGHPDLAISLNNLGALRLRQENYEGAERLYGEALAILREALSPDHPHLAIVERNLQRLRTLRGEDPVPVRMIGTAT